TFSASSLSVGTHTITAIYSGDTNFAGATSAALLETVTQAATITTQASSTATSVFGTSVTFTATVVSAGTLATGPVYFLDGSVYLGQASLSNSGVATFSTTTLPAGGNTIVAIYGGDTNFSLSAANRLTQTVTRNTTTASLTASTAISAFGSSVNFTATVSSSGTLASGTVTFDDGATSIGQGVIGVGGIAT